MGIINYLTSLINQPSEYHQNLAFEKSVSEGKIDLSLFNAKNKHLSFGGLGAKVAQQGSLKLFKQVEALATTEQLSKFYIETINWSWARDNMDIIKHLNERGLVSIEDKDIEIIAKNQGTQLFDYVLYDCAYPLSQSLEDSLTSKNLGSFVDKFKKRDLLFGLEKDLPEKPHNKTHKI